MKVCAALALLLSCGSYIVCGAELKVPEKLIGKKTVAIVDLNIKGLKRDLLLKSVSEAVGEAPPKEAEQQYDAVLAQFSGAGAESLSLVLNLQKGDKDPSDGMVLVVGLKDGADSAKVAEFVYSLAPKLKEMMSPDCPKEMEGSLIWYSKAFKMPVANTDKKEAFDFAYSQVPTNQAFSAVMIPDEEATEEAKAKLKPEDAELVDAMLGGSGLCLFSNFGVSDAPTVKLLMLTPDAAGAEKLHKAADSMLVELKKAVPPPFQSVVDLLKVVEAGSNVQVSVGLPDWTKIAKDVMASMAPPK